MQQDYNQIFLSFCAAVYIYTRTYIIIGCGFYSWPWKWFALRIADGHLIVSSNVCVIVTNTFGWSVIVLCACEIILLCSVSSFVFTVHKFGTYSCCKRNIKKSSNNWWTVFVKILRRAVRGSYYLWNSYVSAEGLYPFCAGQLHFLEEDTLRTNIYLHMPPELPLRRSKKIIIYPTNWTGRVCDYMKTATN